MFFPFNNNKMYTLCKKIEIKKLDVYQFNANFKYSEKVTHFTPPHLILITVLILKSNRKCFLGTALCRMPLEQHEHCKSSNKTSPLRMPPPKKFKVVNKPQIL